MINLHSFTSKLLLLIVGFYFITLLSILVVANGYFHRIVDKSQNTIYQEKLDLIWNELMRMEERLQQTGLGEAYFDDFQNTFLDLIKRNYYQSESQRIYPFLIQRDLTVILDPETTQGEQKIFLADWASQLLEGESGSFTATYKNEERWFIYRNFEPWEWIICYTVPISDKYRDVQSFMQDLLFISLAFALVSLGVLSILLVNFTKPIIKLTEVSQKIAQGQLEQTIELGGRDEIGILSQSFNNMQRSIKEKMEDLNEEISERVKAEEQLNAAWRYISNILDSMPSAIIGVNEQGTITQLNNKAEEITGFSILQARDRKISEIYPSLMDEMQKIKLAMSSGRVQMESHQKLLEGKIQRFEDVTIYPLINSGERGAVIRIDDVTEKKRMEEQLAHSQKMDAIGQLAGGIAHDFNNMLGGIIAAAELLKSSPHQKSE
ncbi:MAG: PAS domain S-box protein, partial [Spirochaetaceae bacterium]|nr:PAS domain S-box protein [Spirochaetaceae bacterium]